MTKRLVRSWDVFDTLIARRCGHAYAIFDLMSAVLGDDFRTSRIEAESTVRASKQSICLDDIYDQLQLERGWSVDERQSALQLEIRTEFSNVIPIAENLSRVRDGDVLVSDMYLPQEMIMRLLRSAGLDKDVTLFVSTNGKADGSMWRLLKAHYFILKHTGDDPGRDFVRPLWHRIPAGLTDASAETPWERVLRCNGAPALSAFVREMRLRAFVKSTDTRKLKTAQIEANFPLLLLASAALVHWCRERGVSRALMASRDCALWAPLAEKVARRGGHDLAVEYFLISRVAALRPSEKYLEYAARRITPDSIVVDLSMTGVSLASLADRLGMKEVRGFVIALHQSMGSSLYGERPQPTAKVKFEFLMAEVIHNDLEALNQALTPSIHDVCETGSGLSVTYAAENRSKTVLEAVRVQNAAFTELVDLVPDSVLEEALAVSKTTRLVFLVRECERHAGNFKTAITRARPGAPLWNDPNGIKLKLPYTTRHPVPRWLAYPLKRVLKPLMRPGSALHRYSRIPGLMLRVLKKAKR